jgi:hypothetical protein
MKKPSILKVRKILYVIPDQPGLVASKQAAGVTTRPNSKAGFWTMPGSSSFALGRD